MHAVLVGLGLGFLVALQLGPMSLFLIRSTLRGGLAVGLAIGAGIAIVDGLYAACGAAGVAPLLRIAPLRLGLGLAGAGALLVLGARSLHSAFAVRLGAEGETAAARPRHAFAAALGATASNPATIVSWAAIFAGASAAGAASGTEAAVLLVAGVAVGSLMWVTTLACGVAAARRHAGPRTLRVVDGLAGVGLIGFGGALGVSAVRHD
jgi:putative LysE/RhtB family amino acid efflux pump